VAKDIVIPSELKLDFFKTAYHSIHKGFMYVIRDEFGAATALKLLEILYKRDDRVKNLVNFIKDVFKIEGNDLEALATWVDFWNELTGIEGTWLERSKTILRGKVTKCPFKTGYKDLSDHIYIWMNIVVKTINPKMTVERPKGMCAGDPYCEYIHKIED
jgi:hypothetical protein